MPSHVNRTLTAVVTTALGAVLLPLTLSVTTAEAGTASPRAVGGLTPIASSDGALPDSIPTAQVALRRAKAVLNGNAHGRDLTLTLRDLDARLPQLRGHDRAVAKAMLARPNGGHTGLESRIGAKWPGDEANSSPQCSLTVPVCVHWTDTSRHQPPGARANNVPDQVDDTLAVMENVWEVETNQLGYREPLTDQRASVDHDGTNFDVYLSDIGNIGYYGYCTIDDSRNFKNYNFYDRSGYCVVDDDFAHSQFPTNTPLENLQVTAAHEFFHAIQFGYDSYEDVWYMEATAAWMEDEVYDGVNDNLQYLKLSPLKHPETPLDTSRGLSVYGGWIFFRYLSERFGADLVRKSWEHNDGAKGAPNLYSLRGINRVLENQGTTLGNVFADHARANLAPQEYYSEGGSYPTTSYKVHGLGDRNRSTGWINHRIDHLASFYTGARPSSSVGANAHARVQVDAPGRITGSQARVLVHYDNGTYVVKRVALDGSGKGGVTVDFGRGNVRRVSVSLSNAGTRYSHCFRYRTQYACGGGQPVDDNRLYSTKITVT
ncbi:MAG TPA: MXAN_6640 family putative metalloprotease [Actinomycetes bacterium]|nr:MXAN_6640 family putative metalloprotease [Actinomycetes bacterium]